MTHDYIADAITAHYGPRCPDTEPGCPCCDAWAQYDALRDDQATRDAAEDLATAYMAGRYDGRVAVRVKPLQFKDEDCDGVLTSRETGEIFRVFQHGSGQFVAPSVWPMMFDTPLAAIVAVNKRHASRILSAIETVPAAQVWAEAIEVAKSTFYIDCEFDGHDGPLLSMSMVREDGWSLHVKVGNVAVSDPWVRDNVLPILDSHHADRSWDVHENEVGAVLRGFIGDCQHPTIIADSPVDIGRFCRAISTGEDGGWVSADYPGMTFIVRNVDCYPTPLDGANQHNAWWDAMALRAALRAIAGDCHE